MPWVAQAWLFRYGVEEPIAFRYEADSNVLRVLAGQTEFSETLESKYNLVCRPRGGADFTGGGLLRLSGAPIVLTAGTNIDIENVEMVGGGIDNSGNLEIDNLTWPIFGGTFLG